MFKTVSQNGVLHIIADPTPQTDDPLTARQVYEIKQLFTDLAPPPEPPPPTDYNLNFQQGEGYYAGFEVAEPTEAFWHAWRVDPEAVKARGYTVTKFRNKWVVRRNAEEFV